MKKILFAFILLSSVFLSSALAQNETVTAYFAGGCFWCVEADFEKHDGVFEAISGYMGGTTVNPTYKQVSRGNTGHREAVEVHYDPSIISYQELLDIFWRLHDPTDDKGSFVDRGFHYGSAIYYTTEEERVLAEGAKAALDASAKFNKSVATEITEATPFYVAEEYHQDYYIKSAQRYKFYRNGSGRDRFIDQFWAGDDTVYQLEENLAQN